MSKSGGVRLSAGALKGRSLPVPPGVRPTEARVREALFDIFGPALRGGRFLDLFAGSGAVGLEALSRGAGAVLLVDAEAGTIRSLERHVADLGLTVVESACLHLPRQLARLRPRQFDWVFADPPYDFAAYDDLLGVLPAVLAAGGIAVIEHDRRTVLAATAGRLARTDQRTYGETRLSFYRESASE